MTMTYQQQYYQRNKEKIKFANRLRYQSKRGEINSTRRQKYNDDPVVIRSRVMAWQASNPEKRKQSQIKDRKKHPDRLRIWKQNNRDKVKASLMKRYALTRGASDAELITREEIFLRDKGRCQYCNKKVQSSDWHLDHVYPVSLGGKHTRDNVCVSCPMCNLSKHNKVKKVG